MSELAILSAAVIVGGVIMWIARGGRSPEITQDTSQGQMVGRGCMALLAGIAVIVLVLAALGAAVGHPMGRPDDPAQYERAQQWARDTLPAEYWDATPDARGAMLLGALPVVLVLAVLVGWLVASLFI